MPRVPAQSNLVPAQSISGADPCCKFAEIEACEGSTGLPLGMPCGSSIASADTVLNHVPWGAKILKAFAAVPWPRDTDSREGSFDTSVPAPSGSSVLALGRPK